MIRSYAERGFVLLALAFDCKAWGGKPVDSRTIKSVETRSPRGGRAFGRSIWKSVSKHVSASWVRGSRMVLSGGEVNWAR